MPKHTNPSADLAPVVKTLAEIIDLEAIRPLDGHFVVDFADGDKIGGRVLNAHDDTEVVTFAIQVTVS